jgi:hypothetical protein
MQNANNHQRQVTGDEEDRRNRFLSSQSTESGPRAASQPPTSTDQSSLLSTTALQQQNHQQQQQQQQQQQPQQPQPPQSSFSGALGGGPGWSIQQQRTPTSSTGLGQGLNARSGLPASVPTRSSFPANTPQFNFSGVMRGSRAFGSTFEDDESLEALSDTYDEFYVPPSMMRGRQYAHDLTRSRSHSLVTRPGAIGSQLHRLSPPGAWNEPPLSSSASSSNTPESRFNEISPPGISRYSSLGALARSPSNELRPHSPIGGGGGSSVVGNGYANRPHQHPADISNISPFVRDLGQILGEDSATFRDPWGGINPENGTGGGLNSGTTSRRHSVSVVQPRRGGNIVGFQAGATDVDETIPMSSRSSVFRPSAYVSGLLLTDEDLASDLGLLNLNSPGISSSVHPPSQPASLPIYAPLSRSPALSGEMSRYSSINLAIPTSGSFAHRQPLNSPSDSGLSTGASPTRSGGGGGGHFDDVYGSRGAGAGSGGGAHQATTDAQTQLTARFVPGQGIHYLPSQGTNGNYARARAPSYSSPRSASGQQLYQPQPSPQHQRRPSDASAQQGLNELGKGVPLHAVPSSWPLYIVEFKAGRTDLFYLMDLSLDIRVGDLVIVEADRGKDLGKVVNDSITIQQVEAFQRQQLARVGYGGEPMSPGSAGSAGAGGVSVGATAGAKREINPKMIYGKAQSQDTQFVFFFFFRLVFTLIVGADCWLQSYRMKIRRCNCVRVK